MSNSARETAPRRSPTEGGYARGEETRARIISVALKIFGEEGYARASTRQIATAAGVTPPALQYYFDSKEGLHRACAEFLIESAGGMINPALQAAEAVLADGPPDAAIDALCDILDVLVDASLFTKGSPEWGAFSMRVQSERDSPAEALIQAQIGAPIREISARLVARATSSPLDERARLRAIAILSQVSAFNIQRGGPLKSLGWPDFDGARRDAIKAVLREHTRGALGS
jgi:AcrR family transcriptional regulator